MATNVLAILIYSAHCVSVDVGTTRSMPYNIQHTI